MRAHSAPRSSEGLSGKEKHERNEDVELCVTGTGSFGFFLWADLLALSCELHPAFSAYALKFYLFHIVVTGEIKCFSMLNLNPLRKSREEEQSPWWIWAANFISRNWQT